MVVQVYQEYKSMSINAKYEQKKFYITMGQKKLVEFTVCPTMLNFLHVIEATVVSNVLCHS